MEGKTAEQVAKMQAQALSDMRSSPGWKVLWDWYEKQLQAINIQQARVDTVSDEASSDLVARRLAYNQGFYAGSANLKSYFINWLEDQLSKGKVPGVPEGGEV